MAALYPSSWTRAVVQSHLNTFLRFCYNAAWIDRIPKLSPIKIDEPETEPLTDAEYNKLLEHAKGKTRTLIKLMRWSGLAVRDAATLQRTDLSFNRAKIYRIIRKRTKTGSGSTSLSPKTWRRNCLLCSTATRSMSFGTGSPPALR